VPVWSPLLIAAVLWSFLPLLAFGFAGDDIREHVSRWSRPLRLLFPASFCIPYILVAIDAFHLLWSWTALYLVLPIVVTLILNDAARCDPMQQGNWRDFLVLLFLGCAVDLRWFESAWPPHFSVVGKLILLDSGLYGFCAIRQLNNVGYDLRLRTEDFTIGLRELAFFAPIAVPLGLILGFLHWHPGLPRLETAAATWLFTFFAIAIPEEIFFRGWMQNLLERRVGRTAALLTTSAIFGLAHFNKRSVTFNWRYVLLAAMAGIFYGRAWRTRHRVGTSATTHATVDAVWSLWLL